MDKPNQVLRISLSPLQAARVKLFLDAAKKRTGTKGIFGSICPHLDLERGEGILELQIASFSPETLRKLNRLLREERRRFG